VSAFVAPLFGLALVLLGLAFLRRHRRTWQDRKNDPAIELSERKYYHRQYRRRMLTSGLLVLLGVLIPIGDALLERKFPLMAATLYWVGVLLIVLFVLSLGFLDLFAAGLHTKDAMLRIRGEKAALEREVQEIRRTIRDQPPPTEDDATRDGRAGRSLLRDGQERPAGDRPRIS
jgi:hypothetical protein